MHPIWQVSGKRFTHCVYPCVYIDAVYVNESDTRERRLKRKHEPRHEITCFMPYANNKDTQYVHLRSLISALLFAVQIVYYLSKL